MSGKGSSYHGHVYSFLHPCCSCSNNTVKHFTFIQRGGTIFFVLYNTAYCIACDLLSALEEKLCSGSSTNYVPSNIYLLQMSASGGFLW